MSDDQVARSIQLQQAIYDRLAELAYGDFEQATRISRQMAEIATRGQIVADSILPVFLQISRDNRSSIAQVAMALKVQLEELSDTLNDLRGDLADWEEFFKSTDDAE
jgi:hypothetical protein